MNAMSLVVGGCVLAGLANIFGILAVSHFFTNELLFSTYPGAFSPEGCFVILLWGCAYIAATAAPQKTPALFAVFTVEKFFYAGTWGFWYAAHGDKVPALTEQSWLTGTFMLAYGANDLLWGLFFAWAFVQVRRAELPA